MIKFAYQLPRILRRGPIIKLWQEVFRETYRASPTMQQSVIYVDGGLK